MARILVLAISCLLGLGPSVAWAQDANQAPSPLPFQHGPGTFAMGDNLAEIELSDNFVFLDRAGTQRLLELTENPLSGTEVATVLPSSDAEQWFVIYEWDPVGYVPDDESDLDADALLESIMEGTRVANAEREKLGWTTMNIVGWHDPPRYDDAGHNLTWAIEAESMGTPNINRVVKVLGRRGVMTVTLVASPDELAIADFQLDGLLADYRFKPGSTYAEYLPGTDKIAQFGLAALVAGGAGAALVQSGLLARFWKLILAGFVGVGAFVRRLFTRERAEDQPITRV